MLLQLNEEPRWDFYGRDGKTVIWIQNNVVFISLCTCARRSFFPSASHLKISRKIQHVFLNIKIMWIYLDNRNPNSTISIISLAPIEIRTIWKTFKKINEKLSRSCKTTESYGSSTIILWRQEKVSLLTQSDCVISILFVTITLYHQIKKIYIIWQRIKVNFIRFYDYYYAHPIHIDLTEITRVIVKNIKRNRMRVYGNRHLKVKNVTWGKYLPI